MALDAPAPAAVSVLAGLPVPVTVFGFDADSGGVEQKRPVRVELQVDAALSELFGALPVRLGVAVATSTILAAGDADLAVSTRFTSIAAGFSVGPVLPFVPGAPAGAGFSVGVAPALLFEHVYVDEGFNLDAYAVGVRTRGRFAWPVTSDGGVAVLAEAGWERYSPPLDRTTYFNHRLERTVLVSLCGGVSVAVP